MGEKKCKSRQQSPAASSQFGISAEKKLFDAKENFTPTSAFHLKKILILHDSIRPLTSRRKLYRIARSKKKPLLKYTFLLQWDIVQIVKVQISVYCVLLRKSCFPRGKIGQADTSCQIRSRIQQRYIVVSSWGHR